MPPWNGDPPPEGRSVSREELVERLRAFQREAQALDAVVHLVQRVRPAWLQDRSGNISAMQNLTKVAVSACERAIQSLEGEASG